DDRRPPTRVPLVAARHRPLAVLREQRLVRGVPVRTFPARGFEEDGTERLLALVERADANPAIRFPLLARVDDAVGLVETLRRTRTNVGPGFLVIVEARDVRSRRVDLGDARRHPLGDAARDAGGFL